MLCQKFTIQNRRFTSCERCIISRKDRLGHATERGKIATKTRSIIIAGDSFTAAMHHFKLVLRIGEALKSAFADRIEDHDLGTALCCAPQIAKHAGMVGAGILSDYKNSIGLLEILKQNSSLANTYRLFERHTAGLMAHVGAVREIVRAISPHEKLIEKCRFVGCTARGIKFHTVWRIEALQYVANSAKSFIPLNGFVFVGCCIVAHRMRQTPRVLERIIGPRLQFRNRMLCEELRCCASLGRLPGHRLHTVLAELERRAVLGIAPCATRTIETVWLVGLEKSTRTGKRCTAGKQLLATAFQCAPPTCSTRPLADELGSRSFAHVVILNCIAFALNAYHITMQYFSQFRHPLCVQNGQSPS